MEGVHTMSGRADQQPSADNTAPPVIQTTPAQLLRPVLVGSSPTHCRCTDCQTTLHEGQQVGLYAYRLADADHWDIARVFCRDCTLERFVGPTLGAAELLVTGTLGTVSFLRTQSHRLCVVDVLTRVVSPPTEGSQA
jgi:hypothetical protein